MFFEVLNIGSGKSEIAFAVSDDKLNWEYGSNNFKEKFHLSYPYIFKLEQNNLYAKQSSIRIALLDCTKQKIFQISGNLFLI